MQFLTLGPTGQTSEGPQTVRVSLTYDQATELARHAERAGNPPKK